MRLILLKNKKNFATGSLLYLQEILRRYSAKSAIAPYRNLGVATHGVARGVEALAHSPAMLGALLLANQHHAPATKSHII